MYDLYALPLHLVVNQEQPDLPGLLISAPPRRTERGRDEDMLIILLSMTAGNLLSASEMDSLLQKMASTYYTTQGSVTAGLQATAAYLNDYLLKYNIRRTRDEQQALAMLNLAALRKEYLYVAHGGPTHTFVISLENAEDFCDPQAVPRSLGLGRTINLRFFQRQVATDNIIILCAKPPETWTTDALSSNQQLTIESLRRRLISRSGGDVRSVIIQLKPGAGIIHRLRRRSQTAPLEETHIQAEEAPAQTPSDKTSLNAPPLAQPAPLATDEEKTATPPLSQPTGQTAKEVIPARSTPPGSTARKPDGDVSEPAQAAGIYLSGERLERRDTPRREISRGEVSGQPAPPGEQNRPQWLETLNEKLSHIDGMETRRKLAGALQGWRNFRQRVATGLRKFAAHLLPGQLEDLPSIPPSFLTFIAIAIPLAVVAVATTVYFRNGRSTEYQRYLQNAQEAVLRAETQTDDPVLQRELWVQTLDIIKKAEQYGNTSDIIKLRQETDKAIDTIDGITRVEVRPALQQDLLNTVNITRFVATDTELFGLDMSEGRILRFFWTAQGTYQLDQTFECSPGPTGTIIVGHFIDMVTLPANNFQGASILAADANGNIAYCSINKPMISKPLPTDKNVNLKVTAIAMQYDNLYVLDAADNAVWRYQGTNSDFTTTPYTFFDKDTPLMTDVIDMAVYQEYLFLLHHDGRMTRSTAATTKLEFTQFADMPYIDFRPGHKQEPLDLKDATFTLLQIVQPLEPSLYMLDVKNSAVYRFGIGLNLYGQLRARPAGDFLLPDQSPSAFVVTNDQTIVVAYNNQLYFAPLP